MWEAILKSTSIAIKAAEITPITWNADTRESSDVDKNGGKTIAPWRRGEKARVLSRGASPASDPAGAKKTTPPTPSEEGCPRRHRGLQEPCPHWTDPAWPLSSASLVSAWGKRHAAHATRLRDGSLIGVKVPSSFIRCPDCIDWKQGSRGLCGSSLRL